MFAFFGNHKIKLQLNVVNVIEIMVAGTQFTPASDVTYDSMCECIHFEHNMRLGSIICFVLSVPDITNMVYWYTSLPHNYEVNNIFQ